MHNAKGMLQVGDCMCQVSFLVIAIKKYCNNEKYVVF